MTEEEGLAVLSRSRHDDNAPTLVEVLRARAQMRCGATPSMMREHAWYIDEAADRIEELELLVSVLEGDALEAGRR